MDRITTTDGVVVHRHLITGADGCWLALGPNNWLLSARTADDLLLQIAAAAGVDEGLDVLRGMLERSAESSRRHQRHEVLYQQRKVAHG